MMASDHRKQCSTTVAIGEIMHIKTTRHQCIPIRVAKNKTKLTPPSTGEGVKQPELSALPEGIQKRYSHSGEQCGSFL